MLFSIVVKNDNEYNLVCLNCCMYLRICCQQEKETKMSRFNPKTLLWSIVISVAAVGIVALFDFLLPTKNTSLSEHGWGFYILLLVVCFLIILGSLSKVDAEKEDRVNYKHEFIRDTIFSALFLFLAFEHYSSHETVRDWVFAIIFTIGLPMEIKSAIKNYKRWKSTPIESSNKEDNS